VFSKRRTAGRSKQ
ncbi:transporter, major facilitator family protein, partial [Toxoplasma gondii ARI]